MTIGSEAHASPRSSHRNWRFRLSEVFRCLSLRARDVCREDRARLVEANRVQETSGFGFKGILGVLNHHQTAREERDEREERSAECAAQAWLAETTTSLQLSSRPPLH